MYLSIPERITLAVLSFLLLTGAIILHVRHTRPPGIITIEHDGVKQEMTLAEAERLVKETSRVKVNTASYEQLTSIPGIGKGLASEILAYRLSGGRFACENDLLRIHGIGPKKLEKMRGYVRFD